MKDYKIILLALGLAVFAFGCGTEEVVQVEEAVPGIKQVEVLDLASARSGLEFSKRGVLSSSQNANVMPEVAGRVTQIYVKEGDYVVEGQVLATLGNSLSSDMINLQNATSQQMRDLSQDAAALGNVASQYAVGSAGKAVELAYNSYRNAIRVRDNSEELLSNQLDSAEDQYDDAKDAYKAAKRAYDEAPAEQREAARAAKNQAKAILDQAEKALDNLETSSDGQLDQMDFAIEAALSQYQVAMIQYQAARNAAALQGVNLNSQLLQSNSAASSAALSAQALTVKAPISGKITDVFMDEGNFASPGQMLMRIENPDDLSVRISINSDISTLLRVGDHVLLEGNFGSVGATIGSVGAEISALDSDSVEIKPNSPIAEPYDKFVKVYFEPRAVHGTFVPLNSIFLKIDGSYLRTVDEKSVILEKKVEVGQIIGDHVEVVSGLIGNERIVPDNSLFLENGEEVKLITHIKR